MTGICPDAAVELHEFYGLTVVVVPPHRPCLRIDHPDSSCRTETQSSPRWSGNSHLARAGRPVLVGTTSVAESGICGASWSRRGRRAASSTPGTDADEATVVAEAGAPAW